ncbi:unnamed protein product [Ectocarpus sp. CCAP 1310/34]|nr:unnamed protein product [Ectocarpus sp. CCAP 1310/34]
MYGCVEGKRCWAGVYVDMATNEIWHLETGGRVYLSPGTAAADPLRGCLRWWAEEDLLHTADCNEKVFSRVDVVSKMRRDPARAGTLAGFTAEVSSTIDAVRGDGSAPANSGGIGKIRLVRDPFGFVFPGCMYVLSMQSGSSSKMANSDGVSVVLNRDGTVTSTAGGERVARWLFPRKKSLAGTNDESWASGNQVLLRFNTDFLQVGLPATAWEVGGSRDVRLSSSDGGRTWLPVSECNSQFKLEKDCDVDSRIILSLVAPLTLSMFPLTAAVSPLVRYLNGDNNFNQEMAPPIATLRNNLQPLVEVFEIQPIRLDGDHGGAPKNIEAIIVISRAVPRPTKGEGDLSCVINGVQTRAVWLSWGMVLCSTARVKAKEATVYITFEDKRFSMDFSFLHAPAPRHLRVGWPATESFGALTRGFSQKAVGLEHAAEIGVSDGFGEGPLETELVLCTMFKNEATYLEEWLQYHQLLGVSRVYLYDNGSSDRSRDLLRKFERSKFVQVRDWPYDGAQTEALNDCLCRFRHTARWMSFIDVDEFIDPAPGLPLRRKMDSVEGNLRQLDAHRFEFVDGYMSARRKRLRHLLEQSIPRRHTHCMAWVNYCSRGQVSKPPGGIIENYHEIEDMGEPKIHMQKPLFRALESLTLRKIGPHFLLYATEDVTLQYRRNLSCPYEWLDPDAFRIRHYRSKSLEEYVQRRTGADSAYRNKRYTKEQLALEWQETNAQCGNDRG